MSSTRLLKLKIKAKSLAEEARIIRAQERKMRGPNWGPRSATLREHRTEVVRREARDTYVAYGFLRGLEYSQIETNPKSEPNWKNVLRMVRTYGDYSDRDRLKNWVPQEAVRRVS